jgi:hypothetical protein
MRRGGGGEDGESEKNGQEQTMEEKERMESLRIKREKRSGTDDGGEG